MILDCRLDNKDLHMDLTTPVLSSSLQSVCLLLSFCHLFRIWILENTVGDYNHNKVFSKSRKTKQVPHSISYKCVIRSCRWQRCDVFMYTHDNKQQQLSHYNEVKLPSC